MRFYLKLFVLFVFVAAAFVTSFTNKPVLSPQKEYRFLLCMSSFKRPIFASGQIFRLMNQTYQNFDISVSLKGIDKKWGRLTIEKEWEQFKKNNRLFVRYDKNRGQLSNLLDTVRDIDLNKYDYYCKIDDDDWYAPTYLENVNDEINREENITVSHSTNAYILTEDIDSTYFSPNWSGLSGPTMCFSRKIMKIALEIEKYPHRVYKYLPDEPGTALFINNEDRLLHHLAARIGTQQYRSSTEPQVVFGWQYRSVMRNDGYVQFK